MIGQRRKMGRADIPEVLGIIRERIMQKDPKNRLGLHVGDGDYRIEDENDPENVWVYICVTPGRRGIRAYDYAEMLGDIEDELRQDFDNVLLVPTLAE